MAKLKKGKSKGFGILISAGAYGGFYFRWGYTKRLCLGWIAFSWLPFDGDDLLKMAAKSIGGDRAN